MFNDVQISENPQENEPVPNYYAIVPANVRYDRTIPPNAKLLYAEITALANKHGYCWASNSYFAVRYDVDRSSVTKWIKSLHNSGYIKISYEYAQGKPNIQRRRIYIAEKLPFPTLPSNRPEGDDMPAGGGGDIFHHPGEPSPPGGGAIFHQGGGEKFHQGGEISQEIIVKVNNKAAAAAVAHNGGKKEPDPRTEAGPPLELKSVFSRVNPVLVFSPGFYHKAASWMAGNALDDAYPAWIFEQAALKKPKNIRGMFVTLFFAGDMAELFRASRKPPPEPVFISCPVCGARHQAGLTQCPECRLEANASPDKIAFEKALFALPPDKKAAYDRRLSGIISASRQSGDFFTPRKLLKALNAEFGLPEG